MVFVLVGKFKKPKADIERLIKKLGAEVSTEIHVGVTAIISTKRKVRKMGKRMRKARKHNIQVVSEEFLEEVQKPDADPMQYITSKSISDWVGDVSISTEKKIPEIDQHSNG